MKRLLLAFSLICSGFQLRAQDHLEPTTFTLSEPQYKYEYYLKVRETLLNDPLYVPVVQLVILPSFGKEFIWQIQYDHESEKYYSVTITGNHSIWYNQYEEKPKKIKAIVTSNSIDNKTGNLIKELFENAIKTTKHPENERIGFDGTSYYFSTFFSTGTIWSPQKETKMHVLVDLCRKLVNHTSENEELSEDLKTKVEQLIDDLEH